MSFVSEHNQIAAGRWTIDGRSDLNFFTQEIAREASSDIEKDVHRTFPNTRRFHSEEGQAQLRNVLRAYASYDPDVAYCQGMNFLTGLLLMYMPSEAHAFAALVVLMEDRKLRSFYHRSMSLLQVRQIP